MDKRTKTERLGEERLNNQECLMKIVEYKGARDIIVEFQDEYKGRVHTEYKHFLKSGVKNPYHPSVYGVGITGNKYPARGKEYKAWHSMLERCFDEKEKEKRPTYLDATCCEDWLNYENFYEWIHSQENFDKWLNGKRWCLDKDIILKGNKIYSPETCCLVPNNVNVLFTKRNNDRGKYYIGVNYHKATNSFIAQVNKNVGKQEHLGCYSTPEEAFLTYKKAKEDYVKQIAQEEYDNGNIIKKCYDAMMRYEVEITD